jgi:hypothetical protein
MKSNAINFFWLITTNPATHSLGISETFPSNIADMKKDVNNLSKFGIPCILFFQIRLKLGPIEDS